MFYNTEWSGITGSHFEEEFVAFIHVPWDGRYVGFAESMRLARENQPKGVVHEEGSKLLKVIAAAMNIDVESLKLYSAAGGNNPLDCFHGIDAFVDMRDRNGEVIVTIPFDFKLDRRRKDTRKAFVVNPTHVETSFMWLVKDIVHFIDCKLHRDVASFA